MSRDIKIVIDGTEADVNQDTPISFNYSIESTEPGKVAGSFSKRSITLPATTNNKRIFENIEQGEVIVNTSNKLLPASASVGGIPILAGKVQLDKVILLNNGVRWKAGNYQIAFIGANADWFADISNLLIRDLNWGEIELTVGNYDALGNAEPTNDDVCFTLIKWQPWKVATRVAYTELTPAVFVGAVLRRAFNAIGYRIESIFDTDPFNRIIIPVPLAVDPDYAKQFINIRATLPIYQIPLSETGTFFGETIIMTNDNVEPNFDGGNNYDTSTGIYTAPLSGLYAITFEFVAQFRTDTPRWVLGIVVAQPGNPGQTVAYFDMTSSGAQVIEWIGELQEGATVSIDIFTSDYQELDENGAILDMELRIEAEKEEWNLGEIMRLQYQIPSEWFVRDLIKDLTKVFNLNWQTDVLQRKVFAYPKDRSKINHRVNANGVGTTTDFEGFYLRDDQIDITRKVDLGLGGEMVLKDDKKQDQVLAWVTSDDTAEELETRTGANLYSARYRFADNRYAVGSEWTYTDLYAKTVHITDTKISSGGIGVQVPLLYGANYFEDEEDVKADWTLAPRLLYFAGRRSGNDGYIRMYNASSSGTNAYDVPYSFMVNYNDPSAADFSLSFADEITNAGGIVKGLYKSLHLQTQARIEEGRVFDIYVFWDEIDISELSFRRALTIRGVRYLLERIDGFQPGRNTSTRTYLMLDKLATVADAGKVAGAVALQTEGQNTLTTLANVTGAITEPQDPLRGIIRYWEVFLNATERNINLPLSSGIHLLQNPYVGVSVYQNGKLLYPNTDFTITLNRVTVGVDTHFEGANYMVKIHDALNNLQEPFGTIVRYVERFDNQTTNVIELPAASGITLVTDSYLAIMVSQNGKLLYPELEFTITDREVTINEDVHFEGANYIIKVHDLIPAEPEPTGQVVRYWQLFENHTGRDIVLPDESGILLLSRPYVAVQVIQNGKTLHAELEYTISGNTITIEEYTHFDGDNYLIKIHDAI